MRRHTWEVAVNPQEGTGKIPESYGKIEVLGQPEFRAPDGAIELVRAKRGPHISLCLGL